MDHPTDCSEESTRKIMLSKLGKSCLSDHMKDKEARLAYLQHDNLQLMSPGNVYDTSDNIITLCNLTIRDYPSGFWL